MIRQGIGYVTTLAAALLISYGCQSTTPHITNTSKPATTITSKNCTTERFRVISKLEDCANQRVGSVRCRQYLDEMKRTSCTNHEQVGEVIGRYRSGK